MSKPLSKEAKANLSSKQKALWTPERRAQASEAAKARKASGSPPSNASTRSSGSPPVLPPSVNAQQGPGAESLLESLLSKLKEMSPTETKKETSSLPELPEEEADREAALKPARLPARIPVVAFDQVFKLTGLEPLSEGEKEEGINAWAVLFWQWGLFKDGRVLVMLWLMGLAMPRGTTAMLRWREAKKKKELEEGKT